MIPNEHEINMKIDGTRVLRMGAEKQRIAFAILRHYSRFQSLCQRGENVGAHGTKHFHTCFALAGDAVLYSFLENRRVRTPQVGFPEMCEKEIWKWIK